jgi:hypothetical protein
MPAEELVKFLNTLRNFVPGYWRSRIDDVIGKMGGKIKPGTVDTRGW